MKTIFYSKSDKHVGKLCCPSCSTEIYYWASSGMSNMFPHFYCNKCSNAIYRISDQKKIIDAKLDSEVLKEISNSLPNCLCGGKFELDNNPKCPNCNFEFKNKLDATNKLFDPHIILLNGACLYGDKNDKLLPYKVIITDDPNTPLSIN